MASKVVAVLAAVLLVAAAVGGARGAPECNAKELAVCTPAMNKGAAPTAACCDTLRSHEPCFCQYANNPAYKRFLPNARKTLTSCKIAIPKC